jgi:type III restriction enzyme
MHEHDCCIVVATIQALRVTNTEGRKVYAHNEALEPHFAGLPRHMPGLEVIEDGRHGAGQVRFSFANLLHLHRPLMIVDEAHKAVTDLSQDMQRRVNPCAIIEFTATPRPRSNLLHSVTAQELKAAEMIKLPVVLSEHLTWQQAVDAAIARQAELEAVARADADYIRPIVLFQAQDKGQEANVAVLKAYLLDNGIAENRIRIATGDQRELDAVNLFDPACPVDFVITVEALKEGWDCSFAYVFCSLANVGSATDAEQLLGRVLRMPYARRRKDDRLNRAYAHLASPRFADAAMALRDRMVAMGFDESEAEANILAPQGELEGLFTHQPRPRPAFVFELGGGDAADGDGTGSHELANRVREAAPGKIEIVTTPSGPAIRVAGFLTPQERQAAQQAMEPARAKAFAQAHVRHEAEYAARLSPAEQGATFVVPALVAHVQGELELADTDVLMEHSAWSLMDHPVHLDAGQFSLTETGRLFEIDLDGRKLTVTQGQAAGVQGMLDIDVEGWSETGLARFLARELRAPDLSPGDLLAWSVSAVSHLVGVRHLPVAGLMQARYVLARKLGEQITAIRRTVRKGVFQQCLFAPQARPDVSYERGFTFRDGMFADARRYTGNLTFSRHFLGQDNLPAFDGKAGGEEEMCAFALDSLPPETLKYWVRNVAQHRDAFRLPLAQGHFYPDFVAELADGRLFIVEYKGDGFTTTDDTREKVAVGELWEKAMNGKGLFLLVERTVKGRDARTQMLDKIG